MSSKHTLLIQALHKCRLGYCFNVLFKLKMATAEDILEYSSTPSILVELFNPISEKQINEQNVRNIINTIRQLQTQSIQGSNTIGQIQSPNKSDTHCISAPTQGNISITPNNDSGSVMNNDRSKIIDKAWNQILSYNDGNVSEVYQWVLCCKCKQCRIMKVSISEIKRWIAPKDWICRMNMCNIPMPKPNNSTHSRFELCVLDIQKYIASVKYDGINANLVNLGNILVKYEKEFVDIHEQSNTHLNDSMTSENKSETGNMNEKEWICAVCTLRNKYSDNICTMCQSAKVSVNEWICGKCTFKNTHFGLECAICDTVKAGYELRKSDAMCARELQQQIYAKQAEATRLRNESNSSMAMDEENEESINNSNDRNNNKPVQRRKSNAQSMNEQKSNAAPRVIIDLGNPHQCYQCNKTFKNKWYLRSHLVTHSEERPFQCNKCGSAFKQKGHLKNHLVTHSDERPFQCDECLSAFKLKCALKAHKKTMHNKYKNDSQNNSEFEYRHKCRVCGNGYDQECRVCRDRFRQKTVYAYKCDVCGNGFRHESNMKEHRKIHSVDKPYKCPVQVCRYHNEGFRQENGLRNHRAVHSKDRRYKCDICNVTFKRLRGLNSHKETHGERPYKCDLCGNKYKNRGNLNNHKRSHVSERPYECAQCKKRFGQKSVRDAHVKRHRCRQI